MVRPSLFFAFSGCVLLVGAGGCDARTADTDTTACTHDAQLIGRAPCGANGYLLALASPRDTVVAYNLPAEVAARAAQARYRPGAPGPLFAPTSFVRLKVGYALLAPAERTLQVCLATVDLAPFNKLTTNGREIRILCASQVP